MDANRTKLDFLIGYIRYAQERVRETQRTGGCYVQPTFKSYLMEELNYNEEDAIEIQNIIKQDL